MASASMPGGGQASLDEKRPALPRPTSIQKTTSYYIIKTYSPFISFGLAPTLQDGNFHTRFTDIETEAKS